MKKTLCCILNFWLNRPAMLAIVVSASMLAGAYSFEYFGGLFPCDLCWTQRYVHFAILGIGFVGLFLPKTGHPVCIVAFLASAAAGGFHAGVEYKWWEGPTTCTSQSSGAMSTDQLLQNLMSAPIISCEDVVWSLFNISMAGYNFLISLMMAGVLFYALKRQKP